MSVQFHPSTTASAIATSPSSSVASSRSSFRPLHFPHSATTTSSLTPPSGSGSAIASGSGVRASSSSARPALYASSFSSTSSSSGHLGASSMLATAPGLAACRPSPGRHNASIGSLRSSGNSSNIFNAHRSHGGGSAAPHVSASSTSVSGHGSGADALAYPLRSHAYSHKLRDRDGPASFDDGWKKQTPVSSMVASRASPRQTPKHHQLQQQQSHFLTRRPHPPQPPPPSPPSAHKTHVTIHTSMLFDPKTEQFMRNVSIDVDVASGKIARLLEHDDDTEVITRAGDIDLRGKFVMPGLVDANTHVFLHSFKERAAQSQVASESMVERTIRAANHVRAALFAGYTSLRDLGTDGMQSFDTDLRNSINRGLTPGPRLFVATHPLASSAARHLNADVPSSAFDAGDGVAGVVAAVRRRAAAGADVIRVYADARRRPRRAAAAAAAAETLDRYAPDDDNDGTAAAAADAAPTFKYPELRALVNEARINQIPVAAHATSAEAALMAVEAGVTSLEHGPLDADEELFHAMRERGCIFVPTLAALEALNPDALQSMQRNVRLAYDLGVAIAAGGDAGVFAHGQGARELELLVDAGVPVAAVLSAATINGYKACGGVLSGYRFGWIGEGCQADIVALDVDPRQDSRAFRRMNFIMKDGQIWKLDGARTPLVFGPAELGFPGQDEAEMGWEVVEKPSWRD